MTAEELDRIKRAEEIQRYTENRCEVLEKENAELKKDKEDLIFIRNQKAKCMCKDKEKLTEAKDLICNLLRVTYGEGWNYSLDWKVKAEEFIKEE